MNYVKSMSQQKLRFLLAVYIGLFLNLSVFYHRFEGFVQNFSGLSGVYMVAEVVACVLVTFFLFRMLSLFGRTAWRILSTLVVLCSVAASYYMTLLNVVIGYGIIASVMTTDIDLSKEIVGYQFVLWLILISAVPLVLIWTNAARDTLLKQLKTPGQRFKNVAIVLLAGLMVWAPLNLLGKQQKNSERRTTVDMPSYGGVVANSYLPSNWVSVLGVYAWAQAN